jgi:hypothetical protein
MTLSREAQGHYKPCFSFYLAVNFIARGAGGAAARKKTLIPTVILYDRWYHRILI